MKTTKTEKNIQRVCDVAAELFIEKSFDAVTVEAIIQKAGIARSSFYRFFNDKEDLLARALIPVFVFMADRVEAIDFDKEETIVNEIASCYLDTWKTYSYRLLLAASLQLKIYPLVKAHHDRYAMGIYKAMDKLNEVRLLRNDDPHLSAMILAKIGVKMVQIHTNYPYYENSYTNALRGLLLKW